LRGTNLSGTNLSGADLTGADLTGTKKITDWHLIENYWYSHINNNKGDKEC
jgi:hypothetical protein